MGRDKLNQLCSIQVVGNLKTALGSRPRKNEPHCIALPASRLCKERQGVQSLASLLGSGGQCCPWHLWCWCLIICTSHLLLSLEHLCLDTPKDTEWLVSTGGILCSSECHLGWRFNSTSQPAVCAQWAVYDVYMQIFSCNEYRPCSGIVQFPPENV